jgi:ATP-binding cassette subfamily C (CFTR/MRP) protein 4
VGEAVNLLSNDVMRFDASLLFSVYVWIGPIHTLIVLYLMWREIGIAAVVGIATLLLFIPLQGMYCHRVSMLSQFIANSLLVRCDLHHAD